MTNQWYQHDEVDDDNEGHNNQNNKGLRAHVAKIEKENKELRDTNTKLLTQVRQNTISQVLSAKGVNAKVAKLVPNDVEPTTEAVEKWLEDNADLFPAAKPPEGDGAKPPEGDGANSPEGDGTGDSTKDAEQMGRMSTAVNTGTPPGKVQDLKAKLMDKGLTHEQLIDLIHASGGGAGAG